jgi:hypothetical protein
MAREPIAARAFADAMRVTQPDGCTARLGAARSTSGDGRPPSVARPGKAERAG